MCVMFFVFFRMLLSIYTIAVDGDQGLLISKKEISHLKIVLIRCVLYKIYSITPYVSILLQ